MQEPENVVEGVEAEVRGEVLAAMGAAIQGEGVMEDGNRAEEVTKGA